MRQLNVWAMLGIWAGLSLGAAFYAAWEGYEGRAFAVTVATFSILLLVMLAFAARGVAEGLAAKFGPTHWMWPYPGGRLAFVFTVLTAASVALACFLLVRRAKGVGYSIGWGKNWGLYVLGSFLLFGCV